MQRRRLLEGVWAAAEGVVYPEFVPEMIVRRDPDDFEAPVIEVGGTRSTQPGESASVTFEDLEPGEYRLACTIANHDDLGQYGTLVVERAQAGKE